MDKNSAVKLLDETFNNDFDVNRYLTLIKELFNNFPELREKRSCFGYRLVFHRTKEELEKELKRLAKEKIEVSANSLELL